MSRKEATPNPPAIPVCSYQYQLLAKIPAPPEKTAQTPPRASEQSTLYQYVWDTVHKRILATVKECPSNAADEKSLGSGNLARQFWKLQFAQNSNSSVSKFEKSKIDYMLTYKIAEPNVICRSIVSLLFFEIDAPLPLIRQLHNHAANYQAQHVLVLVVVGAWIEGAARGCDKAVIVCWSIGRPRYIGKKRGTRRLRCMQTTIEHCNLAESLHAAARKTDKAGEDIPELLDKLQQTTTTYGELLLQASQIQALDQPNRRFLRNLLSVNRGILKDVDTSFLDEPNDDWVSITKQDRLDRLISQILATKIGRVLACQTPLRSKTEMIGEDKLDDYHEGVMKFAIFTVFSLILGVFTCAPAGIQSLNVVSTIGEVAVYVAFVIVFGWLSLGFLGGFERSLLTSLAFAGLMANLLRGND
ncbi:unnamed protein product [Fusarium graminearum]|uniref:Chromosome 4, complete genome n=1 Tax=Gibberella zeae (strain ATCC MYA-4620 / CBS 123657 / FGSC 9075 / NRRL 31084 / PH-1) TaxID=229533 RepID=A0A0E0SAQ5_GIBZE|nr:hypothetical protein FG05_13045 [Fusarium graminearum]CEF83518.1 unnamed protein product [Fusarium graminearum]CZS72813.1 unnamed protein product [Fusarium graminearum]